ncbi:MAG: hypothetical protein M1828_000526 [Chrysothrix sp. TS-e1954]|nr:MAG: hypothetical protein M1828_000526 [Chrysothrix sp. TS-e1954]
MGLKDTLRGLKTESSSGQAQHDDDSESTGPRVLIEGQDPTVDIVFLHGLTGKRDDTWTASDAKEPWPKLWLKEDLPQARVITYGYDADVMHLTKQAGLSSIREHAKSLISDLSNLRSALGSDTGRPIIFVVHSLGGLVCQDALLTCMNPNDDRDRKILDSTYGIMFFGTPHAGSGLAPFAEAVVSLVDFRLGNKPNRHVLEVLKSNSTVLANNENDFLTLVKRRLEDGPSPIALFVFLEELPLKHLGRRVVEPESAKIKGYDFANIHADHVGMTKFAKKSTSYERVLGRLRQWTTDIASNRGHDSRTNPPKERGAKRKFTDVTSYDREPNDPSLGTERYYKLRGSVKYFVRREALLQALDRACNAREENRSRVVVLQGMGGQGKTQIAIDYSHDCRRTRRFSAVFFLDASSEQSLRKGLVGLLDSLKQTGQIFEDNESRLQFVLDTIRAWNQRWLLVYDNYDTPKSFPNLHRDYIPQSAHGTVLVTSRFRELGELGEIISVPPMEPHEATKLLLTTIGATDEAILATDSTSCAHEVVQRLAFLPLAVHQAAAYIKRRRLALSHFLAAYETKKAEIWSQTPMLWTYDGTVYTTWELSYELIDDDDHMRARKGAMLTMLAFLDFRSISRELFNLPRTLSSSLDPNTDILGFVEPPWLRDVLSEDGAWNVRTLDDMLDDFRDLSLLQITERQKQGAFKISLHPLVAEWMKFRARKDGITEIQCLVQASVLVAACRKAMTETRGFALLSEGTRQEILKHQASCIANLDDFMSSTSPSDFNAELEAFLGQSLSVGDYRRQDSLVTSDDGIIRNRSDSTQREVLETIHDDRDSQMRIVMIEWLSSEPSEATFQSLRATRIRFTAQWLFGLQPYHTWLSGDVRFLLCTGPRK